MSRVGDGADSWIFSYGTLRSTEVQLAVFGRSLVGRQDKLLGFQLAQVEITNSEVIAISQTCTHPVVVRGEDTDAVAGVALSVTADELIAADRYETNDYERACVILASGLHAYVYLAASDRSAPLPGS